MSSALHFLALLLALLLTFLPAGFGLAQDQPTGDRWTMSEFMRECGPEVYPPNECSYFFRITEEQSKTGADCSFIVQREVGEPAYIFGGARCAETSAYHINGGYLEDLEKDASFVVISVVKPSEDLVAYYGVDNDELGDGKVAEERTVDVFRRSNHLVLEWGKSTYLLSEKE